MAKHYEPTAGTDFERAFVRRLNSRKWGVHTNQRLDQCGKIDVVSRFHNDRKIPCPIEVQITRDVNNADKLDRFISVQKERRNGGAKVYVMVHNGVSAELAAEQADKMFLRDLLRKGVADKLFLLDVLSANECEWANIYARNKELAEEKQQKLVSADRRQGTIVAVRKNGAGLIIKFKAQRFFFAFYSEIPDGQLSQQLKRDEVVLGTMVTFLPTSKLSEGRFFLAESVMLA